MGKYSSRVKGFPVPIMTTATTASPTMMPSMVTPHFMAGLVGPMNNGSDP
jgi:hypothetical protein